MLTLASDLGESQEVRVPPRASHQLWVLGWPVTPGRIKGPGSPHPSPLAQRQVLSVSLPWENWGTGGRGLYRGSPAATPMPPSRQRCHTQVPLPWPPPEPLDRVMAPVGCSPTQGLGRDVPDGQPRFSIVTP